MARQVIGGWSAAQYGLKTGDHVEVEVAQFDTKTGGKFVNVSFGKPYLSRNPVDAPGTYKKGFNFSEKDIGDLVCKINWFLANYTQLGIAYQPISAPAVQQQQVYQAPLAPPQQQQPTTYQQIPPNTYQAPQPPAQQQFYQAPSQQTQQVPFNQQKNENEPW